MTPIKILDALWDAHRDTPFSSFSLQKRLDLRDDELSHVLNLLSAMADSGEAQNGYSVHKPADTIYKLIKHRMNDSDTAKGKPLTDENEGLTGDSERSLSSSDAEIEPLEQNINIGSLLMPLRAGIPVFRAAQDKADFNESRLTWWEYQPESTASDIIKHADAGRIFVPGHFVRCPERRRFRHTKATWQGTRMIATDADQIKGIEFDDDGNDKTPTGVEAFTDPNRLFELYPSLPNEAYAIGHSLSNLSKPPPHIRCRIYFVLEIEIRTETDYKWMLLGLSAIYRIISASRQPAQPVYGNAGRRRIFKDGQVQEQPQPFKTKIFGNVLSTERIREIIERGKQAELEQAAEAEPERRREDTEQTANRSEQGEGIPIESQTTLTEWLFANNIPTRGERDGKYLFVDCPWENQHTSDFGAKDTAVWEDKEFGFCFRCLHDHCKARQWSDYRQAVAPREAYTPPRHDYHIQRSIYRRRDYR